MLKTLFTSKVRVKILKKFFLQKEERFYVRELTRDLDEQVNAVRRELEALKKIGLLKSLDENRKKYYFLNQHFLIYPELSSIIIKNFVLDIDIQKDLLAM
jgi:predicted transcriptional regulator